MDVTINWQQLAAFVGVIGATSGAGLLVLRGQLSRYFPSRSEHRQLSERVSAVEAAQRTAPTGADMAALTARVGAVETNVAVVKQKLDGISEGMQRVEKWVDMLVKHQLEKESAP